MKKITNIYIYVTICGIIISCVVIFKISNKVKSIQTNSTPITNKVIVLDAGHGLPDEGTVGFSGTKEQAINLALVLKLQSLIEQSGATVILTRSDKNGIYEVQNNTIRSKKVSDMKNRVYIGNNSNADIFISVHLNYYEQSKYYGWQTFYQKNNKNSKQLAEIIQKEINENIKIKNNRVPKVITDVYIMKKVTIPTVIVECGFLSNKQEEQKLNQDDYQQSLVWGIYIGIQKYFGEIKNE